ncbi:hypothetical protein HY285_05430 [Candidatus Peregrinibacteria bacterium]|nr:hypothetical protein [Candidatus Peregrinibacteria bacterium]MBI3816951.1 hypothetical protein [Candidatus Peregrinibacteria bacterium]
MSVCKRVPGGIAATRSATITIEKAFWNGSGLDLVVQGKLPLITTKKEEDTMDTTQAIELIKHLTERTDNFKINTKNKITKREEYSGVDLVLQ